MVNDDDEYFDDDEIIDNETTTNASNILDDYDELSFKILEMNATINTQLELTTLIFKHLNIPLPEGYDNVDVFIEDTRQIYYEIDIEDIIKSRGYKLADDDIDESTGEKVED